MSLQKENRLISKAAGSLLGLACGDALGTTLEFKPKDSCKPLTDMVGGGPFSLEPGQWTDDTSMMLCLADSLIEQGCVDTHDQIQRYVRWRFDGYNSCTGSCFDIGITVSKALSSYQETGVAESGPVDLNSAGNGSLMRVAPIALFFSNKSVADALEAAQLSSLTTHGEERCVQACQMMTFILHSILNQTDLDEPKQFLKKILADYLRVIGHCNPEIKEIATCKFYEKDLDSIRGTGYVVSSLEAALWWFINSDSFGEGALLAANLGDDADTTAAIFGQVAGAYYGMSGIPTAWLNRLAWVEHIKDAAIWLVSMPTDTMLKEFASEASSCITQSGSDDAYLTLLRINMA
ncbi:ADP-ribosylglycohydrolase family protein [Photobacterium leiognathi]|uniref:ADP-ribosylglycohydrolase family protein n=1 Tax=Photobacterium leiognathi TaxID=553611 RepID=UPI001EDD627D|nr:ADP-ribosylglycohydrolase family protein [Photobacterium leiognathi]MCG3884551.1 ADP-ribosylglycohydrolase family protein [Photobacterium leiognathi]